MHAMKSFRATLPVLAASLVFSLALARPALADVPSGGDGGTSGGSSSGGSTSGGSASGGSSSGGSSSGGSSSGGSGSGGSSSGGSSSGGSSSGGSTSGGSTSGGSTGSASSGGGCAIAEPGQDGLLAFAMLGIGACAFAWQRRRNR
jgi:hypothetical protein